MKVLVVDDRLENRLILETKLKAAGFQVDCASNGVEGLRKLRGDHFDLVVTDLMMPQMDGYQMTHVIKTDDALKDVPILVYTATYMDAKDEALALNLGANGFIRKPATDDEFFTAVRELVVKAEEHRLPQRKPTTEELSYLRQYNERLVQKLEDKVDVLEQTQRRLRDLNASLEGRVKDATAELRMANQELEAFVYSVSHDLRAPLRSIQGYAATLQADGASLTEPERKSYLARITTLATQAQGLIQDLLEYAHLKSANLPLNPVSLPSAVSTAIEQLDPGTRERGTIEVVDLKSTVIANYPTLVQAVQNLLSNALKFTEPGTAAHVVVSEEQRNGWARLIVRDDGIGIASEHRERIFKVFERLHDTATYPGTGVGLAIVQRAVDKMRGRMGLESQPGSGSTFWIELPQQH